MKRVLTAALIILATTALPTFAADGSGCGACDDKTEMMRHPHMQQGMMRDPQHLLMRAYHQNVAVFARALADVARQGETVPKDVARTAITEMRRSTEEMEKLRAAALRDDRAKGAGQGQMQKMLDEHLVAAKTNLRQLEELLGKERMPSREVLQHLQVLSQGCEEVASAHRMQGDHGGAMDCAGCRCSGMKNMAERHGMRQDLVQKMKQQDIDMGRQVEKMHQASGDRKLDLLSDLVTRMVQQRAEMTAHMEQMQHHLHGAAAGMRHCGHCGSDMTHCSGEDMNNDDGEDNDSD